MTSELDTQDLQGGCPYANTFAACRNNRKNFDAHMKIGGRIVPDKHIRVYVHAHQRLLQAIVIHNSNFHYIWVYMESCSSIHFTFGLDLEKIQWGDGGGSQHRGGT